MAEQSTTPLHLRGGGSSVVVDVEPGRFPSIVHWGVDLGDAAASELRSLAVAALPQRVSGGLDHPTGLSLLPLESQGWQFEPGLTGSRADGTAFTPLFSEVEVEVEVEGTGNRLVVHAQDAELALGLRLELELGDTGLLRQRATLRNLAGADYLLDALTLNFPLPHTAVELLDTTGRHLKERSPQRSRFTIGDHVRASRRGRPGADASLLLFAGEAGFGFRRGLVHGIHVAWSGNHRLAAHRSPAADSWLSGGELLLAGEGIVAAGAEYTTPWVIGSWGVGLDELAARFHEAARARPRHPSFPRPVTLNTWEAVYFDHDLGRLTALADRAASVGVERFVLDDGWFRGRRDDTAGLGDWFVDDVVWPRGLSPLIEHVTAAGMQFGLWVEPEMVNLESDLAREHPDWILHPDPRWPVEARNQHVLNLAHPEAFAYILERLDALLTEYDIAYLKWDHNRDLLEAADPRTGRAAVHDTTAALYRLLDELRSRHPGLEIESCASGGARVDLGILDRTDRLWTSDCIDPIERLDTQAYTNLLVPYELMGAHVGAAESHSTHRTTRLDLQAGVALFCHFGIEWDLTALDDASLARLAEWVAVYRRDRALFHSGTSVHADVVDPSVDIRGVVAPDGSRGLFAVTQRSASVGSPVGRITLPGLSPDSTYEVRLAPPTTTLAGPGQSPLAWTTSPITLTGRMLGAVGVQAPVQYPEDLVLIEALAV